MTGAVVAVCVNACDVPATVKVAGAVKSGVDDSCNSNWSAFATFVQRTLYVDADATVAATSISGFAGAPHGGGGTTRKMPRAERVLGQLLKVDRKSTRLNSSHIPL